jgi:hypothetical protein
MTYNQSNNKSNKSKKGKNTDNKTNNTNNTNNTNIVVSRYKKNVDFVYQINNNQNINVLIYDKENPDNPLNVPVNKGNEASVYLKYIIDFYDNLSDYTFFIHDDEYAWHHSGSLIDKYKEAVASKKKYYNINDKCNNSTNDVVRECEKSGWIRDFLCWYKQFLHDYIPFNQLDFKTSYRNSAQFLVHKDTIRKLPKQLYIDLYNWIITTNLPNSQSGRYLEWTWHILWETYPNLENRKIKRNYSLSIATSFAILLTIFSLFFIPASAPPLIASIII